MHHVHPRLTLHRVLNFERLTATGENRSDCPCSAARRSCTRGAAATVGLALLHRAAAAEAAASGADVIT